jgi:FKBP-type peptidyl-prolyl cis-trans isomerase
MKKTAYILTLVALCLTLPACGQSQPPAAAPAPQAQAAQPAPAVTPVVEAPKAEAPKPAEPPKAEAAPEAKVDLANLPTPPADTSAAANADLADATKKISYSLGAQYGKSLKSDELSVDVDVFYGAMKDALEGKPLRMTEEEIRKNMVEFQKTLIAKRQEQHAKKAEENVGVGKAFLEENGKKEGVVTTASGLQYKVITDGTGPMPKDTDRVQVNYRGTLINGEEFDSSFSRGKPAEFAVNKVVKGWTEALQLMKAGSKWTIYVPSELGYGERGSGRKIGPNEVLIFEIELLEVLPAAEIKTDMPVPTGGAIQVNPAGAGAAQQ